MSENDVVKPTGEKSSKAAKSPIKWWQWVLVYPSLIIGVMGAIPTMIEAVKAYQYDVPIFTSAAAERQLSLYKRNADCLTGAALVPIITKSNVEIATLVCDSGDVLLMGKRPGWRYPQQRWVSWDEIAPDSTGQEFSFNLFQGIISSAHANEEGGIQVAQWGPTTIICQRWVGNGLLLQRIYATRGCFDQVVNTYNGWIVNRVWAPCHPQC